MTDHSTHGTAQVRYQDGSLSRWCKWCGCPVTDLGRHRNDGSFGPASVKVTQVMIGQALDSAPGSRNTRYNIALGLHVGAYK